MAVLNSLLSPISIAFTVIIFGYFIGRIKIGKVSLDLSGILIVAVLVGWLLAEITQQWAIVDMEEFESYMKFYSAFGTALFVSSIGISTGGILDFHKWKDMKAIVIGSLMVFSAFITMRSISLLDKNITVSILLGSLCGALTTTPGLSAACELKNVVSEDVVLGYGCTYLFGVIAAVLFVQLTTRNLNSICEGDKRKVDSDERKAALNGLIQIGCVIILGRLIGNIELLDFSLGNSGGMLCSGIVIGLIVKNTFPKSVLKIKDLTLFRSMGLALFFVGNGIPAGMQISGGVDLKIIFYGVLLTTVPIFFGMILHKLFFNDGFSATTIAGGMTSTPAMGVLIERCNNISLTKYALAYFGALMTVVVLIRVSA